MVLPQPSLVRLSNGLAAVYEGGTPTGKPLVFLPSYWLAASVFYYQLVATSLQGYRLLLCELPGQGQASRTELGLGPAALRMLLLELLRKLEVEEAILVGHSYAGQWLLDILPQLPHLRGLVLIGVVPASSATDLAIAAGDDERLGLFFVADWNEQEIQALAAASLREAASARELREVSTHLRTSDGRGRTALAETIAAGQLVDERKVLLETKVSILLMQGEQERFWKLDYLRSVPMPSRWGEVRILPKAAHLPFFENAQVFNELLLAFCQALEN